MPDDERALGLERVEDPVEECRLGGGCPDPVARPGRVAEAGPVEGDDAVARGQPLDQPADREVLGHGPVAVHQHDGPPAAAHDDVDGQAVDRHEPARRAPDHLRPARALRDPHRGLGLPHRPLYGAGRLLARIVDRLLGRPGHRFGGGLRRGLRRGLGRRFDGPGDLPRRAGEAAAHETLGAAGRGEGKHGDLAGCPSDAILGIANPGPRPEPPIPATGAVVGAAASGSAAAAGAVRVGGRRMGSVSATATSPSRAARRRQRRPDRAPGSGAAQRGRASRSRAGPRG